VYCGPGHIQRIYSSSYSGLNIRLNASALLLEIIGHFDARYTTNFVSNKAHIVQFTLCDLWSRTYTKYLMFRIFMLQYSAVGICAAIVDITTIQCALYCKLGAKYSAHPQVYAVLTVIPAICNVVSALHIEALIFNLIYLRGYCRYVDISMLLILQTWCQIQLTSCRLRYLNCCPGHVQCNYSSAYSGLNIQLNVSALMLEVYRQCNVRYTALIVPNTEHILQITLC
jgi:hypothetical protein